MKKVNEVKKVTIDKKEVNEVKTVTIDKKEVTTIATALNNYFEKYGKLICNNTNKQERKQIMANTIGKDFPQLAINGYDRASDVATIFCKMLSNGHNSVQFEKYRVINGNVKIVQNGKSWEVAVELKKENTTITKDLQELENGEMRFNLSNISSEERHAIALAKLISVTYQLAFTVSTDKEIRDIKENIGRGEVYKYASKMTI